MPLKNKMVTKILVALVFFVWEHRIIEPLYVYQWMSFSLHGQSEAVFPDLGYDIHVISKKFVLLFLRCHFTRKLVVGS